MEFFVSQIHFENMINENKTPVTDIVFWTTLFLRQILRNSHFLE